MLSQIVNLLPFVTTTPTTIKLTTTTTVALTGFVCTHKIQAEEECLCKYCLVVTTQDLFIYYYLAEISVQKLTN